MTVPEVLDVSTDCDLCGADSEFPYDKNADGDNMLAMNFRRNRDGGYSVYDVAAHRAITGTRICGSASSTGIRFPYSNIEMRMPRSSDVKHILASSSGESSVTPKPSHRWRNIAIVLSDLIPGEQTAQVCAN
jgi:hypothetical protein